MHALILTAAACQPVPAGQLRSGVWYTIAPSSPSGACLPVSHAAAWWDLSQITTARLGWILAIWLTAGYVLGWTQTWFLNRYEVALVRRCPRGLFRPRITRRWYGTSAHVCLRAEAGAEKPERYLVIAWDAEAVAVPWLLVDNLDNAEYGDPSWMPVTAFAPFTVRKIRPYVERVGRVPVPHLRDYLPLRQPAGYLGGDA